MRKLEGQIAIVTGAGRGIGRATAVKLAREGAKVVVNDLDFHVAKDTVSQIKDFGFEATAVVGSVTDSDFPKRLILGALDSYNGIDIVVNNAGYIWNGAMHNHSDEQFQAMLDVHLSSPFRILREFSAWLKPQAAGEIKANGQAKCRKIVNISSVSGTTGSATQIAYSSSKAGVIGLTKTLAKEWGRYNVTCNCVAFGPIDTRLTQAYSSVPPTIEVAGHEVKVGLSEKQLGGLASVSPLGRTGTPEDAAGAVYLFCVPESNFITGEVLTCAGGL